MRALRSFTVRPSLPAELAALEELAMNLRWAWDSNTRDLFRWVDPEGWDATLHDPVRLLGVVPPERFEALTDDAGFMRFLAEVREDLQRYLQGNRWFQTRNGAAATALRSVAYFSPEFGIAEAVPQYSGGLGVLAGDHLKAASDLGVPMVGVGLFYRHGYFRQTLSADGWQEERYPDLDPHAMALTPCEGVRVEIDLAGTALVARVWRADVGRVPLYLLDSDLEDNPPEVRGITDRLYGGDTEHRLRQEILLGIGGVRALRALGVDVQVFHSNEGHAAFLGLERIREMVSAQGLTFPEALEAARAGCVFTTHTPVPAGIDRFPRELMERYFDRFATEAGISIEELIALGRRPGDGHESPFNMAVLGLRLAARSNAVAALHGEVTREMFADLWPDVPEPEVPIGSITNGIHAPTWVSPEMDDVLTRYVLPEWQEADAARWARVTEAGDHEVWRAREHGREQLVAFVRDHLRWQLEVRDRSASDVSWTEEVLDPRALTIGFARRFAAYKRAALLLSQSARLRSLLLSTDRPVQIVFAGKSHPADDAGKELIRQVSAFAADPEVRHRFVFLQDYDIAIARALYQGCDVWLNNPLRRQEACGTSGMKSALNGGLNLSILDGWWAECFNGENGWAISSADHVKDPARRDELEAASLFEILERRVVPLYYERWEGPVPRRWVRRVKRSLASLGPFVTASRMMRDYAAKMYEPAAAHHDALNRDGSVGAKELADWKQRVLAGWHGVHVDRVEVPGTVAELGASRSVEAVVSLGELTAQDVEVQLLHGSVGQADELAVAGVVPMTYSGAAPDGHASYRGSFTCERAGRYGVTVRIVPRHHALASPLELGRIAWA